MVKVWSEGETAAKIAEAISERDEWAAREASSVKSRDDWRQRWMLSLGFGNGAALLGVANVLVRPEAPPPTLIYSAWAFALGVVLASLLPLTASRVGQHESDFSWAKSREAAGKDFTITESRRTWSSSEYRSHKRARRALWLRIGFALEILAALCFAIGIVVGLAAIASDTPTRSGATAAPVSSTAIKGK